MTRNAEYDAIFGPNPHLGGTCNDLMAMATQIRGQGTCPALYQWCGTEDALYTENVRFRDHVQSLGLPLTYEESPGGHDWACWDQQIQRVLNWLPLQDRTAIAP